MIDSAAKIEIFREEISHVDDVSELNRKRGTKKTIITKAQHYLEKLDPNPEFWNYADLVKKFDGPNIACKHYWRASVASETLTGVTQSKIGDVYLLASERSERDTLRGNTIEISLYLFIRY